MTDGIDSDHDIAAEAYAWVAQIESGDFSAPDRAALKQWMGRSPQHAAEIRAVAALSAELAGLTELLEPLLVEAKAAPREAPRAEGLVRRLAPVAAILVLAIIGTVYYFEFYRVPSEHAFYATAVGDYSTKTLSDGSVIKLNTDSAVEVIYDLSAREVRLIRGEAFFEVAKNHSWPFIVYAGANAVRAVGTAFSVSFYKDEMHLAVTKGVVQVTKLAPSAVPGRAMPHKAETGGRAVLVKAGYELASRPNDSQQQMEKMTADDRRHLAWTEGFLDFSNTPLSEVVREVSRHTAVHIEIADPTLRDIRFGGVFPVGDVQSLLKALPRVGVTVARINDHEIRLYAENDKPASSMK